MMNIIDKSVIIGHIPEREIKDKIVKIGEGAIIRSGTVIYCGVMIGKNLETGHNVVIREETIIGDNFRIWNNSTIDYGCKIGNNVKIHNNVYVAQYTIIEDDVFIAPGVVIANDLHPLYAKSTKGGVIKKGAIIGINATIFSGITIGEYSLVAAGSVVIKDFPPYSVILGNPAEFYCSIHNLK